MNIRPLESLTKEELIEIIRHERDVPSDDAIYVLKLALEYWADRQQRYRNRAPVWVQKARALLDNKNGEE